METVEPHEVTGWDTLVWDQCHLPVEEILCFTNPSTSFHCRLPCEARPQQGEGLEAVVAHKPIR